MEVVNDVLKEFDVFKGTSKAGKPYSVNLAVFEEFGTVSLGFNKPDALGLKAGEKVAIEIEKKFGKWEYVRTVDIDTEATLLRAPIPEPKVVSGGTPRGGYAPKPFPVPDTHGDMSIIHQNSLTHAREVVMTEAYAELMEDQMEGKSNEEVKQIVVDEIINLAYQFADFSSGKHLERLAKGK